MGYDVRLSMHFMTNCGGVAHAGTELPVYGYCSSCLGAGSAGQTLRNRHSDSCLSYPIISCSMFSQLSPKPADLAPMWTRAPFEERAGSWLVISFVPDQICFIIIRMEDCVPLWYVNATHGWRDTILPDLADHKSGNFPVLVWPAGVHHHVREPNLTINVRVYFMFSKSYARRLELDDAET